MSTTSSTAASMINDDARTYHSTKALSKSSMDDLLKCPALFKQTLDNMGQEEAPTPAMILGSLFHHMVLETSTLLEHWGVKRNSGASKAGKEEAALAAEKGITLVSPDVWETCEKMQSAALSHPLMRAAMAATDCRTETSIYWTERGSIPCKARIDAMATIPGIGLCLIDLKSTNDASPDGISKHLYDYGYHRQAAWYTHALKTAGLEPKAFVFLFCEKQSPYLTTAATVSENALWLALEEINGALDTYEHCAAEGVWPGYTNEIITEIDLPAWAYRRIA